jgi:hypothetical protein
MNITEQQDGDNDEAKSQADLRCDYEVGAQFESCDLSQNGYE